MPARAAKLFLPILTTAERLQTYSGTVVVRTGCIIPEWMWSLMNVSLSFRALEAPSVVQGNSYRYRWGTCLILLNKQSEGCTAYVSSQGCLRVSKTYISIIPLQVVCRSSRRGHRPSYERMRGQSFLSNTEEIMCSHPLLPRVTLA